MSRACGRWACGWRSSFTTSAANLRMWMTSGSCFARSMAARNSSRGLRWRLRVVRRRVWFRGLRAAGFSAGTARRGGVAWLSKAVRRAAILAAVSCLRISGENLRWPHRFGNLCYVFACRTGTSALQDGIEHQPPVVARRPPKLRRHVHQRAQQFPFHFIEVTRIRFLVRHPKLSTPFLQFVQVLK